jgi:hypothetical protein
VNGRDPEARKQLEMALAVGTRDVKLFQHAAAIAADLGDLDNSARYKKAVLQLNQHERR